MNELPRGYEVFEKYDTNIMYLRKNKKSKYSLREITILEAELIKNTTVGSFKIDVYGDLIKIYIVDKGDLIDDDDSSKLSGFMGLINSKINSLFRYNERMRIYKQTVNGEQEYKFQRYCYRGSVDDWILVDSGDEFKKLVKENIYHLGKDSYFELLPYC